MSYEESEKEITCVLQDYPVCYGISLQEQLKRFKYCNIISGIFTEVMSLRRFNGTYEEIECRTNDDRACVFELMLLE